MFVTSSSPPNTSATANGRSQPLNAPRLTSIAHSAAIHGPINGTKRSTAARNPQRTAYGTPIANRLPPTASPKIKNSKNNQNKKQHTHDPTTTNARVVTASVP